MGFLNERIVGLQQRVKKQTQLAANYRLGANAFIAQAMAFGQKRFLQKPLT